MELIFEIILSIIFEGSIEGMKSKVIPTWIRVICTIVVALVFLFVVGIIGILTFVLLKQEQFLLSGIFLLLDLVIIILAFKKIKNYFNKNLEKK